MSRVAAIALLTLREAVRRRLVAAFAAISAGLVGLSAWGFDRLSHSSSLTSGEVQVSVPQSLVLFMFMFSFVVALSASAISSPAISAEIESGVLRAVATRPIRRSEIVLGKWFGLAALLAIYAAVACTLELAVVDWVSGFAPPDPVAVGAHLFAEGVVLLTLALALGTRLPALATGVLGIALFGAAWLAGVVGALGTSFHVGALRTAGDVARYVLPTDGLLHGANYYLEPRSYLARRAAEAIGSKGNPFFAASPPPWSYLVFSALWLLVVLGAALVSFERREL
ncbi:MAG TPA: ABC transporter permease [Acidimicrobiales bacterium]|nr:ABC transporter permease [Acidimicrobiales bacterium]